MTERIKVIDQVLLISTGFWIYREFWAKYLYTYQVLWNIWILDDKKGILSRGIFSLKIHQNFQLKSLETKAASICGKKKESIEQKYLIM